MAPPPSKRARLRSSPTRKRAQITSSGSSESNPNTQQEDKEKGGTAASTFEFTQVTSLPHAYLLKEMPLSEVYYVPSFVSPSQAQEWYDGLLNLDSWYQPKLKIYGREVTQSRKIAAYSTDPSLILKYSGQTVDMRYTYPPLLRLIQDKVEQLLGVQFNHVMLNLYEDGGVYIGNHRDNLENKVIASLSLGAPRTFIMTRDHKVKPPTPGLSDSYSLPLNPDTNVATSQSPPSSSFNKSVEMTPKPKQSRKRKPDQELDQEGSGCADGKASKKRREEDVMAGMYQFESGSNKINTDGIGVVEPTEPDDDRKWVDKHVGVGVGVPAVEKKTWILDPGSLVVMQGETQRYWKHQIPKESKVKGGRISLTFRQLVNGTSS